MSITLTKNQYQPFIIASIILIALGPWVVNLVIEFPSPFFQGETRFLGLAAARLCPRLPGSGLQLSISIDSLAALVKIRSLSHKMFSTCAILAGKWALLLLSLFYGADSLFAHALSHCFLQYIDPDYPCHPQCLWQGH